MANELTAASPLAPTNFAEAMRFAELAAASDLVPKDFVGKPGNIVLALQLGYEVGLGPVQALQSIAVVNGRPTLWGDAVLALVRASGKLESIDETDDGSTATCTVKRRGDPSPVVRRFGVEDAKRAGLANKSGPWTQYPARMRQMRARAFALRDAFADVLRGIAVREEVEDYSDAVETTATAVPQAAEPVARPRRRSEVQRETVATMVRTAELRDAANGSKYLAVELEGFDGVAAGAFSRTAIESLTAALETQSAVQVEYTRTPKGGIRIEAAEPLTEAEVSA